MRSLLFLLLLIALPHAVTVHAETPHRGHHSWYMHNPSEEVPSNELDHPPLVRQPAAVRYPTELKGTGYIGQVTVMGQLQKDGSLKYPTAVSSNDVLFVKAVADAAKVWRFDAPEKNGIRVLAHVSVNVLISETEPVRIEPDSRNEKPNKSPEATPGDAPSGFQSRWPRAAQLERWAQKRAP